MSQKINLKELLRELKEKIREFYPYFLGFYLLSLIISIFSKVWDSFFYWPAFHGSVLFFTLLFALTFKFKINFKHKLKISGFHFKSSLIFELTQNSIKRAGKEFDKYLNSLVNLNRKSWIKIFIIIVILIFAIFKQIEVFNFLILIYALISIFFILDNRWSAGAALVFLISCPFLLILKKDALAETFAIYAYYFLVITVLTQIRELKKIKNKIINVC